MKKNRRCPACEKGHLMGVTSAEAMPFRHSPAVVPEWPVSVPTCDECGERFIDEATAKALDKALEAALSRRQHEHLLTSIEALSQEHTQRDWEKRLDLSPGYLSRLKAGKESSVTLTTCLVLLAENPGAAWQRVEEIWSNAGHAEETPAPVVYATRHLKLVSPAANNAPIVGPLHAVTTMATYKLPDAA